MPHGNQQLTPQQVNMLQQKYMLQTALMQGQQLSQEQLNLLGYLQQTTAPLEQMVWGVNYNTNQPTSTNSQNWETKIAMPNYQDMGNKEPDKPPYVQRFFFPTSPFYSTANKVAYQTRYYSEGIVFNTDYTVVNSEVVRDVSFDIPVTLIAINASAVPLSKAGDAVDPVSVGLTDVQGIDPRDLFLIRLEYTTGDNLTVSPRLASTVAGAADSNAGEIGGAGYIINSGGNLQIGITPLFKNLRIDVTLHCLEARANANFTR